MDLLAAEAFYEWACLPANDNEMVELVRGQPRVTPLPDRRHGVVCSLAASLLHEFVRKRRRGYACLGSGVVLQRNPDTVRCPDVSVFEQSKTYEELNERFCDDVPSLVVEVVSAFNTAEGVAEKVDDLLNGGVGLVWLIDPEGRTATVHRQGARPRRFAAHEELSGEASLPGLVCPVEAFFLLPAERRRPRHEENDCGPSTEG